MVIKILMHVITSNDV